MIEDPEPKPAHDRISVDELFRAHAGFVATFLHHLRTPRHEIDDLVQEVFVVAHRKGGFEKGLAHPKSWLAAIALRLAQAARRARSRGEALNAQALEQVSAPATDPDARVDADRAAVRIQLALDALPLEQRVAFVLFELDGESCDSIAEICQVPLGTVYSRLHYARRRFMEACATLNHAGPDHFRKLAGKR